MKVLCYRSPRKRIQEVFLTWFQGPGPRVLSLVLNQSPCVLTPCSALVCHYLQDPPFSQAWGGPVFCGASSVVAASPWKKEAIKSEEGDVCPHSGGCTGANLKRLRGPVSSLGQAHSVWAVFFLGFPGSPRSVHIFQGCAQFRASER